MKVSTENSTEPRSATTENLTEEDKVNLQKQKLAGIAQLREELGINKIELTLSELGQTGKIQPVNDGDWKRLAQSVVGMIGEGINKFGGGGGENPLMGMLMQDMVETNRMVKLIFSRAVAKSVGINLPEHKVA